MSKKRILIVDDEPDIIEFLADRLESLNFEIQSANNGIEALGKIEQNIPDGVLLDIRMPKMDGIEVLEIMRKRYPKIPVIIITASTEKDLALKCVEKGAKDYILKPIDPEELKEKIERSFRYI